MITRLVSPGGIVHAYRREVQHFGPLDLCLPFSQAACGRGDPSYQGLEESEAQITCSHCLRSLRAVQRKLAKAPVHAWAATERCTLCGLADPYVAVYHLDPAAQVTCKSCIKVIAVGAARSCS